MYDLSEHSIDGAMFLRKCSREEAIKWLTEPVSKAEIEEFMRDHRNGRLISAFNLGLEETEEFVRRSRFWDAEFARFMDAVRRSQIITAEDLAIRVGPC